MKIHYRVSGEGIEIVRCFGTDSQVVIPEQIEGKPVIKAAPYAFLQEKTRKRLMYRHMIRIRSDKGRQRKNCLQAMRWRKSFFPNTMREIGRYIFFYGCRNLKKLEFSDNLMQIGSGAFTVCGNLQKLIVHLQFGSKSCVKEILGELWQRMDVTFVYENGAFGGQKAELVFPGHYEEAVENTPARILYTQHHGSGNNYRQCFLAKELDYEKYDELFSMAVVMEKLPVLIDLCFGRLLFPIRLSTRGETAYQGYIRSHLEEIVPYLIKNEQTERIRLISGEKLWTPEGLDMAIECASDKQKSEILSLLMNERQQMQPVRKKKICVVNVQYNRRDICVWKKKTVEKQPKSFNRSAAVF